MPRRGYRSKCTIRLFHYRGDSVEHSENTNLLRPPKTIGGPVIRQIRDTLEAVRNELATGVQMGPLGAVIHRDYRLSADIHIRIFANRIEVESPGLLPGPVTTANPGAIGSRPRNRALVDHLRLSCI